MDFKINPFFAAILYADIFDFPLTQSELWRFAVGEKKLKSHDLKSFLTHLPEAVVTKNGYYFLKGKEHIVSLREQKNKQQGYKIRKAEKAARLLGLIPGIRFIGISGGVSMGNADAEDDIDLFIIVKKNTIFLSRLYATFLLDVFNLRRKRRDQNAKDKICINMFLDERDYAFPEKRQDIYTAHEIIQLVPLVDKDGTYEQFLHANRWISRFVPNGLEKKEPLVREIRDVSLFPHNTFLESLAKQCELWYMKSHRTTEEVSETLLAFHPVDYRHLTLKAYEKRVNTYEKI